MERISDQLFIEFHNILIYRMRNILKTLHKFCCRLFEKSQHYRFPSYVNSQDKERIKHRCMSDLWTVIKNSIEKISEIIRAAFPITGGFLFEHDFRHQINIFYGDLLTAFGCICDIQDLPPQNTLRGLIFSEHDDAVRETNRFIYSAFDNHILFRIRKVGNISVYF